jgi:hypothetical protein
MAEQHFFQLVAGVIEENGFHPTGQTDAGRKGLTLHEAVRMALGTGDSYPKPEVADVGFWEWKEARRFFRAVWTALDDVASDNFGRRTSAIAWSYNPGRIASDVLSILSKASSVDLPPTPTLTRRLSPPGIPQPGKLLGAILESLGTLHELQNISYGDILSSLAYSEASDEDLLAEIDSRCLLLSRDLNVTDKKTFVPRTLGRAFVEVAKRFRGEDNIAPSFSEFLSLEETEGNWAGLSDHSVLKRLLVLAPERADAYSKNIARFLSEE